MADVSSDPAKIWATLSKALGAEPREHAVIKGFSGLNHHVQGLAVDEKAQRVIIFAVESTSREAALMQSDVQALYKDMSILVARPIAIDLSEISRNIARAVGNNGISLKMLQPFLNAVNADPKKRGPRIVSRFFGSTFDPAIKALGHIQMSTLTQLLSFIQQAALLDWSELIASTKDGNIDTAKLSLQRLIEIDNLTLDRQNGICSIPLYEFNENDWEKFKSGKKKDVEETAELLKALDIYQYFFPPADQLALALVDNGFTNRQAIINAVQAAPAMGHPHGSNEIVQGISKLPEIVDALKARGLALETELEFSTTEEGRTFRQKVMVRPRESFVYKLLNRFNFNIGLNPHDLIK